jgi:hypothetical protein
MSWQREREKGRKTKKTTFWATNKLMGGRKMSGYMVNRSTKNKWNHMRMREIHRRIRSFNNNKGISRKKGRKTSKNKFRTKVMTLSMTSSTTSGKYSFKIRKNPKRRMSKRMICRNRSKNLSRK